MGYFGRIFEVSKSILIGMNITLKHMLTPATVTTRQYVGLKKPRGGLLGKAIGLTEGYDKDELEQERYYRPGPYIEDPIPLDYLPQRHRGLHYLETEKCIMCFQCSRACPVDCIDIEGTRDAQGVEGGHRADRATLTRFTIDYSLCIFCDHCTIACPDNQKCIIMGKEFDLSSYSQEGLVKNLLTDKAFDKEDRDFVLEARIEIERLAAEKDAKKKSVVAGKKAASAKKVAQAVIKAATEAGNEAVLAKAKAALEQAEKAAAQGAEAKKAAADSNTRDKAVAAADLAAKAQKAGMAADKAAKAAEKALEAPAEETPKPTPKPKPLPPKAEEKADDAKAEKADAKPDAKAEKADDAKAEKADAKPDAKAEKADDAKADKAEKADDAKPEAKAEKADDAKAEKADDKSDESKDKPEG